MSVSCWTPDGANLVVEADNAEYLPTLPDGAFTLIYVDPPFNTGRAQRRQQTTMGRSDAGDRIGFQGRSYATVKGTLSSYDDVFAAYWAFWNPVLPKHGACWPMTAPCTCIPGARKIQRSTISTMLPWTASPTWLRGW